MLQFFHNHIREKNQHFKHVYYVIKVYTTFYGLWKMLHCFKNSPCNDMMDFIFKF